MRWLAVLSVVALVGCGGGGGEESVSTSSSTTVEATTTTVGAAADYCRLMERTDEDYRSGDLTRQADAEAERIGQAPAELRSLYAEFTDDELGVADETIDAIQDWVLERCGFVPTFDL